MNTIVKELIGIIESIGYKQRTDTYWIIRENDGYINISFYTKNYFDAFNRKDLVGDIDLIEFHKTFYHGVLSTDDTSKKFDNADDFLSFINVYHRKLFRRKKINKIINRIYARR